MYLEKSAELVREHVEGKISTVLYLKKICALQHIEILRLNQEIRKRDKALWEAKHLEIKGN